MYLIRNKEAGFTIIEVIIALLVLAVALMSAAAMQTMAVDQGNSAGRMTERVTATEQMMEDLMSRNIVVTDPANPDHDPIFDNADGAIYDAPVDVASKSYFVQYRMFQNSPLNNLTTIQVAATPRGMTEEERDRKMIVFFFIRSTRWD
jgi:prepilin-type N-terminal cleavage/methylation domain-containing protein